MQPFSRTPAGRSRLMPMLWPWPQNRAPAGFCRVGSSALGSDGQRRWRLPASGTVRGTHESALCRLTSAPAPRMCYDGWPRGTLSPGAVAAAARPCSKILLDEMPSAQIDVARNMRSRAKRAWKALTPALPRFCRAQRGARYRARVKSKQMPRVRSRSARSSSRRRALADCQ
jgi:hypothetical protein